eukprot:TRINITY_DN10834_c0_g1_i1.p2 TRINITY_DN10834_c0_g1~~TRINITY_DN10834_c0_g1_i1.p2  ORF type:complete len:51 (+),score=7.11 TRINITY_DN10834_c0_g1_i1:368-520(+)
MTRFDLSISNFQCRFGFSFPAAIVSHTRQEEASVLLKDRPGFAYSIARQI